MSRGGEFAVRPPIRVHGVLANGVSTILQTMGHEFRWITWNLGKVEGHGLAASEVEAVVNAARHPFPKPIGNDKWLVIGRTMAGRQIQVIYLVDSEEKLFVIHARPLTPNERRRWRRRR